MIIRTLFLFLLSGTVTFVNADIGSRYSMEATITMKDGSHYRGYFHIATYDLTIEHDDIGLYYYRGGEIMRLRSGEYPGTFDRESIGILETDYHFHTYVRKILSEDSIRLYSSMEIIMYGAEGFNGVVPVYIGDATRLPRVDIQGILVHYVYPVGHGWVETKLEESDRLWLKSKIPVSANPIAEVEICGYMAYLFTDTIPEIKALLDELKQIYAEHTKYILGDKTFDRTRRIKDRIEELRKKKVIVVSFCSC